MKYFNYRRVKTPDRWLYRAPLNLNFDNYGILGDEYNMILSAIKYRKENCSSLNIEH